MDDWTPDDAPTTPPPPRRRRARLRNIAIIAVALLAPTAIAMNAVAAGSNPTRPIAANQTDGFGNGKVTVFTYGQNYDCVHQPFDDRDFDGKPAASDPDEFQQPQCQVASDVGIDPTGSRRARPSRST